MQVDLEQVSNGPFLPCGAELVEALLRTEVLPGHDVHGAQVCEERGLVGLAVQKKKIGKTRSLQQHIN